MSCPHGAYIQIEEKKSKKKLKDDKNNNPEGDDLLFILKSSYGKARHFFKLWVKKNQSNFVGL